MPDSPPASMPPTPSKARSILITLSCLLGMTLLIVGATQLAAWVGAVYGQDPQVDPNAQVIHVGLTDPAYNKLVAGLTVVVAAEDRGEAQTLREFSKALAAKEIRQDEGVALCLMSSGPVLNTPDKVTVAPPQAADNKVEVVIHYTYTTAVNRNQPWRPVVVTALPRLAAGKYALTAKWECTTPPAEGEKVPEPLVEEASLVIREAKGP